MMRAAFLLLTLPALIACAGILKITPVSSAEKERIIKRCEAPFLKNRWRLVHLISGTLPGGANASMIGVSVASPQGGGIRCILMSIEGFVFLDADYDGALVIKRGIGPFESESFVKGVIRDISLMLFRPGGEAAETGSSGEGSVCRYRSDGGVTEALMKDDGSVEIRAYDASLNLMRLVAFKKLRHDGIPGRIELTGYGLLRYSLELDLIEAERLD